MQSKFKHNSLSVQLFYSQLHMNASSIICYNVIQMISNNANNFTKILVNVSSILYVFMCPGSHTRHFLFWLSSWIQMRFCVITCAILLVCYCENDKENIGEFYLLRFNRIISICFNLMWIIFIFSSSMGSYRKYYNYWHFHSRLIPHAPFLIWF